LNTVELLHPDLPALVDAYLRRRRASWQDLERGRLKLGDTVLTVDALQWWFVNADPVLWAECNLVNQPEDGGGLWRLFDYQKASLRFDGNAVHQDGAEVGKTRELLALIAWGSLGIERGSILVGSARDGDLDEIWEELDYQCGANPYLGRRRVRVTTKPYRKINWDNGLRTLFRPAGHDGTAFRGIHVRGWLLLDEAAKVAEDAWKDFWRAAKPGCKIRIYSVPTGLQLISFQRIADGAVPAEQVVPEATPELLIEQLLHPAVPAAVRELSRKMEGRMFVRFWWPKTIMPHPFWSEERRRHYVEQFGSPDAPGYIQNVLGLPGDPANTVFPDRLLTPALTFLPDYRTVTLRWDTRAGRIDALSRRLNPLYPWEDSATGDEPLLEGDEESEGSDVPTPFLNVLQDSIDVSGWETMDPGQRRQLVDRLVLDFVRPIAGDLIVGVDVGSATVTEIAVQRRSTIDALILRISLIGWNWYAQRDFLLALDAILSPAGGWGVDATGVGSVLVDLVQPDFGERMSGYVFNRSTPAIDPDSGEVREDPNSGEPLLISYKELSTQSIERRLHGRRLEFPYDPEVRHLLSNHTYTQSGAAGGRTFKKVDDHLVDALRVAELRKLTDTWGAVAATPPTQFAAPPSNRADSMEIMEKM